MHNYRSKLKTQKSTNLNTLLFKLILELCSLRMNKIAFFLRTFKNKCLECLLSPNSGYSDHCELQERLSL